METATADPPPNKRSGDHSSFGKFLVDAIVTEITTKAKVFFSPIVAICTLSIKPMKKAAAESWERRRELINRP